VKEGQIFLSPISNGKIGPHLDIPTGAWKDGLFGCCNNGPCHPSLWCAMICPQILMGQIMMRMQLTWLGEPGAMISTQYTFRIVAVIVSCYFIYSTCLEIYSRPYDVNTMPGYIPVLKALGAISFSIWALYSLCRTRENIRARYSIPEQHCKGCEDIICATFCGCCTVAQLARHSGDYENHAGACCTQTGHPFGTPLAV
jgi:Cys-rich protein (TIGR01571 family)